jgi:hypothetical protein
MKKNSALPEALFPYSLFLCKDVFFHSAANSQIAIAFSPSSSVEFQLATTIPWIFIPNSCEDEEYLYPTANGMELFT